MKYPLIFATALAIFILGVSFARAAEPDPNMWTAPAGKPVPKLKCKLGPYNDVYKSRAGDAQFLKVHDEDLPAVFARINAEIGENEPRYSAAKYEIFIAKRDVFPGRVFFFIVRKADGCFTNGNILDAIHAAEILGAQ